MRRLIGFAVLMLLVEGLWPLPGVAVTLCKFCSVTDRSQLLGGYEQVSLRPNPLGTDGREMWFAFATRRLSPGLETVREIWLERNICSDQLAGIGARQQLLSDPLGKWSFPDPAWSPDGRYLAYARTDAFQSYASLWVQEFRRDANLPGAATKVGDPILVIDAAPERYNAVWGTSRSNVFAVGGDGRILHYNGSSWSRMTNEISADLFGVWANSPTEAWAVGEAGTILRFDGTSWTPMPSPTSSPLASVWGIPGGEVFAVGATQIFRLGSSPTFTFLTASTVSNIADIWGASRTDLFLAGGGGFACPPNAGAILRHDGGIGNEPCPTFAKRVCPVTYCATVPDCGLVAIPPAGCPPVEGLIEPMAGVWGSEGTDVFAVGGEGAIYHYGVSGWNRMTSPPSPFLHDVWGTSRADVFAVGDAGTILHYDGSLWSSMPSATTSNLFGVWGSSGTDVYAVGDGGDAAKILIVHYDGISWTPVVRNTRIQSVNRHPAWDPSGLRLAFDSDRTGVSKDVWTVGVLPTVATPVQFTSDASRAEQAPAWSPDGSTIAYATNRLGPFTIETAPYPSGSPIAQAEATVALVPHNNPAWSRDGKSIYYDAPRCEDPNNPPDIWRLELASQRKSFANIDLAGDVDADVSRVTLLESGDAIAFTSLAANLGVNTWKGDCVEIKATASGQPGPNYIIGAGAPLRVWLTISGCPIENVDLLPGCYGLQLFSDRGVSGISPSASALSGGKVKLEFAPSDVQALLGLNVTASYQTFNFEIRVPVRESCSPARGKFTLNVRL
jgi:hypothetical protein